MRENLLPFPAPSSYTLNERVYNIDESVRIYQSNGYNKDLISEIAYYISIDRQNLGLSPDDRENWIDAELYLALKEQGIRITSREVLGRRKVLLPNERKENHFRTSNVVNIFLDSKIPKLIGLPRFIEATVTQVQDNIVTFISKRQWHDEKPPSGVNGNANLYDPYFSFRGRRGETCLSDPYILLKGEYDYMINNPEQMDVWLTEVAKFTDTDFKEFENTFRAMRGWF